MATKKTKYIVTASHGEPRESWTANATTTIFCDYVQISDQGDLTFSSKGDGVPARTVAAFRNSYWDSFVEVGIETGGE